MPPTPPPAPAVLRLTLGTAGHIDHGKTSLVRALVGGGDRAGSTDRLQEERERGLTIDIGYAEWRLPDGVEVGIVDVPGHERFVRNMVAGATGMDLVLLVVAADDGVMPQTREHLQIMTLLGMARGAVALTKIDLVDADMRGLVEEDLRALLAGTFLDGAPIFPVSSATGEGLDALRAGLEGLLRATPPRDAAGPFRMPVQRVFTVKGHGTVATGIPVSGRVRRDDRLELLPAGRPTRVRGLQVYHRDAAEAAAGHRTALNLADLDYHEIARGDVVAEPGIFRGATLLDVRLRAVGVPGEGRRALPHGAPVRMLAGTAEAVGKLLLLEGDAVEPGASAFAQVRLDSPIVVAPGDRFILRLPSPAATVAGGVILGPAAKRLPRRRPESVAALEAREAGLADPETGARAALGAAGTAGLDAATLAGAVLRRVPEAKALLAGLVARGEAVALAGGVHLSREAWDRVRGALRAALASFHDRERLRDGLRLAELRASAGATEAAADAALEALVAEGAVVRLPGGRAGLAGRSASPTAAEAALLDRAEAHLREAGFATPREDELPGVLGVDEAALRPLLDLLVERGRVVRFREGVLLHAESVEEGKRRVAARIQETGSLAPSDLKEMLGATRRFGIPFLEHLDSTGFTVRVGDRRVLRER